MKKNTLIESRNFTLLVLLILSNFVFSQVQIEANGIIGQFNGEVFSIIRNDGYAIVNTQGKILADKIKVGKYDHVDKNLFYDGITYDKNEDTNMYRLINYNGKPITDYVFTDIRPFKTDNTFAHKKINGKIKEVFIDTSGKEISHLKDRISVFFDIGQEPYYSGLARFHKGVKYGFINLKNEFVIKPEYKDLRSFNEGLAVAKKEVNFKPLWGYINTKGEVKIPFKYYFEPGSFNSERALVRSRNFLYGYIDKSDNLIIETKYKFATNFYKGQALVKENTKSKTLLINKNGKTIKSFELYPEFNVTAENLKTLVDHKKTMACLKYNYKAGITVNKCVIMDIDGNILTKRRFSRIYNLKNGFAIAYVSKFKDDVPKKGLINEKGEFIVEIVDSKF